MLSVEEELDQLKAELREAQASLADERENIEGLLLGCAEMSIRAAKAERRVSELEEQLLRQQREAERLEALCLLSAVEAAKMDERLQQSRRERTSLSGESDVRTFSPLHMGTTLSYRTATASAISVLRSC